MKEIWNVGHGSFRKNSLMALITVKGEKSINAVKKKKKKTETES